jgi:hypothetical protein
MSSPSVPIQLCSWYEINYDGTPNAGAKAIVRMLAPPVVAGIDYPWNDVTPEAGSNGLVSIELPVGAIFKFINAAGKPYDALIVQQTDGSAQWIPFTSEVTNQTPTTPALYLSFTVPGTYSWKCPTGVTQIAVVCIGGGGAGGSRSQNQGGGGGACLITIYSVVPGQSYSLVVGAGGVANVAGGSDAANTTFDSGAVIAAGGYCPDAHTGNGQGGDAANSLGGTVYNGGSGIESYPDGGGGGGAGGTGGAGTNNVINSNLGGTGGVGMIAGGNGGLGSTATAVATAGEWPGGGGGGYGQWSGTGANGAGGLVMIRAFMD